MQGKEQTQDDLSLMVAAANRMARKHGQIGMYGPEDLAQDALIKLLKYKGERRPSIAWLFKVVRSTACDAGRSYKREAEHRCFFADSEPFFAVCEQANEDGMVYTGGTYIASCEEEHDPDVRPRLKKVLRQMTEPLRVVLVLYAAGLTYEQIAERTKTKVGTVRSRIHYARKRAQELLAEAG